MSSRNGTLADTRPGTPGIIDHFVEWLLTHCPFTTLIVLTLLVAGSVLDFPRPMALAVVVPLADLTLGFLRRSRRPRQVSRRSSPSPRATA